MSSVDLKGMSLLRCYVLWSITFPLHYYFKCSYLKKMISNIIIFFHCNYSQHTVKSVPVIVNVSGLFDVDYRVTVACRDGKVYQLKK